MFNPRERHYTVAELASNWNISQDTIRRLFADHPGVLVIAKPTRRKRIYRVLRIPESVAIAVYQKLTRGGR